MQSIGVIGLGIMGLACARQLEQAGFSVCGYDPFEPAAERAKAAGITTYSQPKDVAAASDLVILFVPGPADTEEVVLGKSGLRAGIRPGCLIANMSTVDPGVNIRLGNILEKDGVLFMDTPVLGGPAGVGHWAFAVGGTDEALEKIMPVLIALGGDRDRVFHVGPLGHGNKLKLLNNMMLGAINACAAETMALAERMGLTQKTLTDVAIAAKGRILSDVYVEIGKRISENRYDEPTFTLEMLTKDNQLCLDMASAYNAPLVLGAAIDSINKMAMAQGFGKQDHACAWKAIRGSWKQAE